MTATQSIIQAEVWPLGQRIVGIRSLTQAEAKKQGWDEGTWQWNDGIAIQLEDGTVLIPSADWEGNQSGALFGIDPDGDPVDVHCFGTEA